MKVLLLPDLHLFSSEIGGDWPSDSFLIFEQRFLPEIKKENPDIIIFPGDILDPHSGKSDPGWPRGDKASTKFVSALKRFDIKNTLALLGNHDYFYPLKNISDMGGPKFIHNNWLIIKDIAFYFFSSRYPDIRKAEADLENIHDVEAKKKILLMHENVSLRDADNVSNEVMKRVSMRFDIIINGHQHSYSRPYKNVFCLSSSLPWRPWAENSHIEITWKEGSNVEINKRENPFGFWLLYPYENRLEHKPVDLGMKIVVARVFLLNASAETVRKMLEELADCILSYVSSPEKTIVRVIVDGRLKEGHERIDIGITELEEKYYSRFYEARSRNIIRVESLEGGGAYLSKEDLRYISIEDVLRILEPEIPKIREFYEEVYDLIEKKHLDRETLIERIKKSKVLEDEI